MPDDKTRSGDKDAPDAYAVGYGRPPRQHQFKPGQSGNPKGRVRKQARMPDIFERLINRRVRVVENGRESDVTVAEAILKRLVMKAMQGDHRSIQMILEMIEEHAPALARRPLVCGITVKQPDGTMRVVSRAISY